MESVCHLWIDGDKSRLENNHPYWHMHYDGPVAKPIVHISNGLVMSQLYAEGLGRESFSSGVILKDARRPATSWKPLTPLMLTLRSWQGNISPYAARDLVATGKVLPINGAACVEYALKIAQVTAKDRTNSYFLDPARDYVVRRIRKEHSGTLTEQTDVQLKANDVCGWVPTSWVVNEFGPSGETRVSTTVSVSELWLNDKQPSELFESRFPVECRVFDSRNEKYYRVMPDGSMQELAEADRDVGATIRQPGLPWYTAHKWLLICLGLVVIMVVLAAANHWRTRLGGRPLV